ncbi:xanthine dehydrogenase FAD-binding subunit [Desulfonatronum thiosulfatophilum]|uniref:Xanthine dehydrogenase FAD-binding subunit n=1 Tax=Desulfonatronum thiosulfatophilum TaxID=617002 RepID=A0A1G6AM06_9BACT|nr:xanthine dehydrogenase FAD-binding subunit XdhB [Desulfonatronum thiosulfatophilum]SDB09429.1 xanthine dehydrogenase FAD-binding subunit [Desulfonatronum thiosulfatophilum]
MFAFESYHRARTLTEALDLLAANPFARPMAGGTDILVRLREGHKEYAEIVDIHGLPELQTITEEDGSLRIGSGATFTSIMASPSVARHVPMLIEAAGWVAGPQIRNVATIGGNICNGSVCADSAAPLLVLNAHLDLIGPEGERLIPLRGFHLGPGRVELRRGEILRSIRIKTDECRDLGTAYVKYSMRQAMDIATIGCGAGVRIRDGAVRELRLAFTVAAPIPVRCTTAETAATGLPLEQAVEAVCETLAQDVSPRTSWRAAGDFRLHIIRTLARRMILAAAKRTENASC